MVQNFYILLGFSLLVLLKAVLDSLQRNHYVPVCCVFDAITLQIEA